MTDERGKTFMDYGVSTWMRVGEYMKHRPAQFIGTLLGSLAIIFILSFNITTSVSNDREIDKIKSGVCSRSIDSSIDQRERCQQLLTELLRNPTPEQARRLREIIEKETP